MVRFVVNANDRFLKIRFICRRDIHEGLRIHVDEREPTALHLDHDAVALFKGMGDLVDVKGDFGYLAWDEGLRFLEAVAEFAPKYLGADQPLVAIGVGGRLDAFFLTR